MQRYFVKNEQMTNSAVTITGDDVKHIAKVMRMNCGDEFIACNLSNRVVQCKITEINADTIVATIVGEKNERTELPIHVTIAQGLPKGDKLDYIIQKGTELGASRFIPFQAARSVVKWDAKKSAKKIERLQKIAKEAAEQSHRSMLPTIESVASLAQLLQSSKDADVRIVAYEEEGRGQNHQRLYEALSQLSIEGSLFVLIGPEGGFSRSEIAELEQAGFISCSLGPRILRTETAPLYVLAAVSYHFEIMR